MNKNASIMFKGKVEELRGYNEWMNSRMLELGLTDVKVAQIGDISNLGLSFNDYLLSKEIKKAI